jgi:cephalosporin hydroxylase
LELIGKGEVLGIDIDIREHNRKEIERHSMYKRIKMIQGSSISSETISQVREYVDGKKAVIVCLDSNHTHEHVLSELNLYASFVTPGSYIIAFDTIVEDLPEGYFSQKRPWGISNNPRTAVDEFLKTARNFEIDTSVDNKILISVAPGGYLRRIN